MECIIDLQGFQKSPNEFIFKEVAIYTLKEDSIPIVYLFSSPYSWINQTKEEMSANVWLSRSYHGIFWGQGDIPYNDLFKTLQKTLYNVKTIYVKGFQKKRWLEEIGMKNVFNLEDIQCPSLKKLRLKASKYDCHHHHHFAVKNSFPYCAAHNAHLLKNWLLNSFHGKTFIHE